MATDEIAVTTDDGWRDTGTAPENVEVLVCCQWSNYVTTAVRYGRTWQGRFGRILAPLAWRPKPRAVYGLEA